MTRVAGGVQIPLRNLRPGSRKPVRCGCRFKCRLHPSAAPVAQLDRAPDYESGGRGFESSPVRQRNQYIVDGLSLLPFWYSYQLATTNCELAGQICCHYGSISLILLASHRLPDCSVNFSLALAQESE